MIVSNLVSLAHLAESTRFLYMIVNFNSLPSPMAFLNASPVAFAFSTTQLQSQTPLLKWSSTQLRFAISTSTTNDNVLAFRITILNQVQLLNLLDSLGNNFSLSNFKVMRKRTESKHVIFMVSTDFLYF